MATVLQRIKPGIAKRWLVFMAGVIWLVVGIRLSGMAFQWLWDYPGNAFVFLLPALAVLYLKYQYVFIKFDKKNIARIEELPEKACAFAFLSWKGYLLITVMMALGITLRHTTLPREYLSILYLGVGMTLIVASFRYFRTFFTPEAVD